MFGDFVDSLGDSSDTKLPAMLRQIFMPSNNIPGPRNSTNSFKKDGDFESNRLQKQ